MSERKSYLTTLARRLYCSRLIEKHPRTTVAFAGKVGSNFGSPHFCLSRIF